MEETLAKIRHAVSTIDPDFKALKSALAALKAAERLASAEQADALPMQKALTKLEAAAAVLNQPDVNAATQAFAADTQTALDNLAFEFAKTLRDAFAARGETMAGRPPTLTVGLLTLKIDIAARKGQWLYGKDALTKPIPLSLNAIIKAYDSQMKRLGKRSLDASAFLAELHKAWNDCIEKRGRMPSGGRINIVELYSQLTLNRQNKRFWNAPSRRTFKDYERELFIRDLVLLRDSEQTTFSADGEQKRIRFGVATKSQAEQASRSVWLPESALDGQYYSDIIFD